MNKTGTLGIDVSYAQGTIDWEKVKRHGIEFAMIRGGYGQKNEDEFARRNCQACNDHGIDMGLYWFSYAYNETMARFEADCVCDLADKFVVRYPIAWDWEYDSDRWTTKDGHPVSAEMYNKMAKAFCERVEERGYYAMLYANKDYLNRYVSRDTLEHFDLWYACYGTLDRESTHLQQWTSELQVGGISGNVDGNFSYIDFPGLLERRGLNKLEVKS